ncbi:MAG: hypothetical protein R6U22_07275, partial [Desulfohalobiaceae bacterium]
MAGTYNKVLLVGRLGRDPDLRYTPADHRTLVGRGKLDELVSAAYHENADLLVFDRELTPA